MSAILAWKAFVNTTENKQTKKNTANPIINICEIESAGIFQGRSLIDMIQQAYNIISFLHKLLKYVNFLYLERTVDNWQISYTTSNSTMEFGNSAIFTRWFVTQNQAPLETPSITG